MTWSAVEKADCEVPCGNPETGRNLPPPKVVLFDWDNTLVDSWACIQAATNATLVAMGHAPWALEDMKGRVALSLRDSFPTLFGERWTEARDIFYRSFSAIHIEHLKPLPGVVDLLDELRALGLRLGIVSNKNGDFLRQEIDHLGWNNWFDGVVGATDAIADKPARTAVEKALEPMGLDAGQEVWLAGDAEVDIECAQISGCVSVLLRADPPRPDEFKRFQPRLRFSSCEDFRALVRELSIPITPV